ncbi:hypothetical protein MMC10_002925 [Thelotrema lepadinum]|nr:hypothetical protein [Thelotrema lepadinum]
MAPNQKSITLEVRFELQRRELMIDFETAARAEAYQMKNKEGRILHDGNNHKQRVWLPMWPSMRYIRGCREGFGIAFESEDDAKAWNQQIMIGKLFKKEVMILREWDKSTLDSKLETETAGLDPKKVTTAPRSRQSSKDRRDRKAAFSKESKED